MLRCHIDEAIKKYNETTQRGEQDPFGDKPVFVGSLDSYVKNGEVLSEFRKMIFSKGNSFVVKEPLGDRLTFC